MSNEIVFFSNPAEPEPNRIELSRRGAEEEKRGKTRKLFISSANLLYQPSR